MDETLNRRDRKQAIKLARKELRGLTLDQLADSSLGDMQSRYGNDYSAEVIEEAFVRTFEAWATLAEANAMKLLLCATEGWE